MKYTAVAALALVVAVASTTSALTFVKPPANLHPKLTPVSNSDLSDLILTLTSDPLTAEPRFKELLDYLKELPGCIAGKTPEAWGSLEEMYAELTPDVFLYICAYNYLVNYSGICNDCVNQFLPPGPGGKPPSECNWPALMAAGVSTFDNMVTHPNIPAGKADLYRMNGMIVFAMGTVCMVEAGFGPDQPTSRS